MSSEIKVSVIIPVYNIAEYLTKSINSILKQTLDGIEIICVNDGSTDNSLDILNEFAAKYSNIIVIDKKNSGPGAARNSGIKIAKGEYIGFVDGDDFIDDKMYEALYNKAKKYDADIAITNAYLYYPDRNEKVVFRDSNLFDKLEAAEVFTAKEYPEIITIVGMWDRIFKRSFVERINFRNPEGRFYEDHLPSFESSVLASKIVLVNESHYYYRQNREGSTINREAKYDYYKFDFLTDYREVHNFLKKTNQYECYQEQFLRYKMPFVVMHQKNMVSFSNFKRYFNEIRKEIDPEDYKKLSNIHYMDWKFLEIYVKCLEKNRLWKCIFMFYINRVVWKDNLFVYFRFPRTEKVLRMKRSHFYQRLQIETINSQVTNLRNENSASLKKIELLIQQIKDNKLEEKSV